MLHCGGSNYACHAQRCALRHASHRHHCTTLGPKRRHWQQPTWRRWQRPKGGSTHGGQGGTSTWYGWPGIVVGGALGWCVADPSTRGGFRDLWLRGAWNTAGGSCWICRSLDWMTLRAHATCTTGWPCTGRHPDDLQHCCSVQHLNCQALLLHSWLRHAARQEIQWAGVDGM